MSKSHFDRCCDFSVVCTVGPTCCVRLHHKSVRTIQSSYFFLIIIGVYVWQIVQTLSSVKLEGEEEKSKGILHQILEELLAPPTVAAVCCYNLSEYVF